MAKSPSFPSRTLRRNLLLRGPAFLVDSSIFTPFFLFSPLNDVLTFEIHGLGSFHSFLQNSPLCPASILYPTLPNPGPAPSYEPCETALRIPSVPVTKSFTSFWAPEWGLFHSFSPLPLREK